MIVEKTLVKNKLLTAGVFLVIALFGCLSGPAASATRDCSSLSGKEMLDCYYEKALYLAILGNYSEAINACEQMLPSAVSGGIDRVTLGNRFSYYNNCITFVAVESGDESYCMNMKEETLMEVFTPFENPEDICRNKVRTKRFEEERLPKIWEEVLRTS